MFRYRCVIDEVGNDSQAWYSVQAKAFSVFNSYANPETARGFSACLM